MKEYAVGIDLGGTNIKGGLVRRDGEVVSRKSIKTEAEGAAAHVIRRIAGLVNDLVAEAGVGKASVVGVGVGSPGPLDTQAGIVHSSGNLRWTNVPLCDMLRPQVGLPVFLENDANAAGFGEAWVGAARNSQCMVLLTLGTGIGGGIVIGGQLWRGVADTGAELGHMTIKFDGRPCNCGNRGCIEAYAAAPAVAARMREAVDAGRDSSLRDAILANEEVDSERIHKAAVAGDALAREIIEETGRFLGVAVASLVNIFNPDYIVLHGGMVNAGEMLLGPLRQEMSGRCFEVSRRHLRILPSALRGDAGIIGAAGCAFSRAGAA